MLNKIFTIFELKCLMLCLQSRSCISGKDFFENRDAFLNKETIQ